MMRDKARKFASVRPLARFSRISLRDLAVTAGPAILIPVAAIVATIWFVRPAEKTRL